MVTGRRLRLLSLKNKGMESILIMSCFAKLVHRQEIVLLTAQVVQGNSCAARDQVMRVVGDGVKSGLSLDARTRGGQRDCCFVSHDGRHVCSSHDASQARDALRSLTPLTQDVGHFVGQEGVAVADARRDQLLQDHGQDVRRAQVAQSEERGEELRQRLLLVSHP